jgi:hypothetical protein
MLHVTARQADSRDQCSAPGASTGAAASAATPFRLGEEQCAEHDEEEEGGAERLWVDGSAAGECCGSWKSHGETGLKSRNPLFSRVLLFPVAGGKRSAESACRSVMTTRYIIPTRWRQSMTPRLA